MKKRFALLAVLAVAFVWGFPGPVPAADYKSEYKLSTVLGKPFPWGIAGERWAELVKEKTAGRINIKTYPGTSLVGGDQTKEFTAIRQGTIDMAIGSTINWSPQVGHRCADQGPGGRGTLQDPLQQGCGAPCMG
jgi:TRAP-type C4-dicarboxylate transport system substrate-binding protein